MSMLLILLALFIVVPLIEIAVIVQVAHLVGGWNAIALLLLISVVGAALVRHEGWVVMSKLRTQLDSGHMPTNELIDGALLLVGGVLMLTPGFVTDAFGLLLVFPPTRVAMRTLLRKRFATRMQVFGVPSKGFRGDGSGQSRPGDDDIIDV